MSVRPFDRGSASDAATVQHADALPALRGGHLQFNSSAITIQVTHPPTHLPAPPCPVGFRFYIQHFPERSETSSGLQVARAAEFPR